MNSLLEEVLAAHGGIDRWKRYGKVSATIVSGGDLFDAKPDAQVKSGFEAWNRDSPVVESARSLGSL
jgi:hypothetical protein